MTRTRPRGADAMVAASGLFSLVAGVSIISPEVRTHVNEFAGDPAVQLGALASRAMDYGNVVVRSAGDFMPDSTPFMGFALVTVILAGMMFRS